MKFILVSLIITEIGLLSLTNTRQFVFSAKVGNGFGKIRSPREKIHDPLVVSKQQQTGPTCDNIRYVTRHGDGASYINHCETLDASFPGMRCIHHDPPIFEIDDIMSESACLSLMNKFNNNNGNLSGSKTLQSSLSSRRTSETKFFSYNEAKDFIDVVFSLTGIPTIRYEEAQVARYESGQEFTWHYDAIQPNLQDESGNRIATILVYLNNVAEGGETVFKDLDLIVKPKLGKALLFFPSFKSGLIDDRTLHCGSKAIDEKWIAQIWIRQGNYTEQMREGLKQRQVKSHTK